METFHMICVNVSVSENRRLRLYPYISDRENVLLFLELFYSFWLATLLFPISRGKQVWYTFLHPCLRGCGFLLIACVGDSNGSCYTYKQAL